MKIQNDDLHDQAVFDATAYEAFLDKLGIPRVKIEQLQVCFVPALLDRVTGAIGDYNAQQLRIRICIQNSAGECYSQAILNHILLHETRHFQQDVHGDYVPGEEQIPYDKRPSEIDANHFVRHHRHQCFIHLPLTEHMVLYAASFAPLTRIQKILVVGVVALEFMAIIAINVLQNKKVKK